MKFKANSSNTERLLFNDLGKVVKGVSPQERFIALDAGESVVLASGKDVAYSATSGDARKYADASLIEINDTVTLGNTETATVEHNFKYIPHITVYKSIIGGWEQAVVGTDITVTSNTDMTIATIENISGGSLTLYINVG